MKKFDLKCGSRTVLRATISRGQMVRRTARKIVLEDADVSGRLRLRDPIPCRLEAPGRRVVTMTSGTPNVPMFNAVYSPDDDVAGPVPGGSRVH